MTFIIGTLQSHGKSEHKQVKWNKITRDHMCKPDSIFPYLQMKYLDIQIFTLFKWLLIFFGKVYLKMSGKSFQGKIYFI